jgi:hypothetical protein
MTLRYAELIIGYETDGTPTAAVCSLCGERIAEEIPKPIEWGEIITTFSDHFKIHVQRKHPHLVPN